MEKSKMMLEFEQETGKQSAILKFITGGQALEQKSYPKLGPYDYNMEYIEWLENQLTWRPVSEKPEKKDYYLVKTLNFVFKAYFDGESFRKVVDQKLVELIATHWLPIPPAPEGE